MLKWNKKGLIFNPIKVKGREWLNEFAQAPHTVLFDNFIRVYFSCRPKPDEKGMYVSYSAYVDLDRKDLTKQIAIAEKPVLDLGKLGCFDEFGVYPFSVIKEKEEFIAYYGGWTRCDSVPFDVAIGIAKSKDGKVFERLGDGPVLSYTPDEPFILSGPKIRKFNNKFYLFYIAGREWILSGEGKPEPVYKIRMAISDDGIHFEKHNKDLIVDKIGKDEAQASPDVIYKNGKYHMFFCYRQGTDYRHNKERTYRIGYASSVDLIHWVRQDDFVGIDISKDGFDSEMVAYPHVFECDGKIYMMYLGNQVGREGFGLAELEGDLI